MSDQILVRAENVGKKFCRDLKRSLWYGMLDVAADVLGRKGSHDRLRASEFWANQEISFQLERGECLGLIGHNGAGKTTLLKMLNGLIKPDHGKISMRGQVGALIALGAGFNPILTGRENIYINGAVLGLSKKEISAKLDDIIKFADIGDFIDTPVQNYSSGMQVRLGFAIATSIEPDVLLLDEVLAVGDAGFRAKCYSRLGKLQRNSAVILVSHSMDYIAHMCNRVIYMERGRMQMFDDPIQGIEAYNRDVGRQSGSKTSAIHQVTAPLKSVDISLDRHDCNHGDTLEVTVRIDSDRAIMNAILSFVAKDETERPVLCWHTSQFDEVIDIPGGTSELRFVVGPLYLHPGRYRCAFNICEAESIEHIAWIQNEFEFTIRTVRRPVGNIPFLAPYQGHSVTRSIPPLNQTPAHSGH